MNARTLCLAILNFGEATGYEIRKQSAEGDFSYFVDTSFGAIYPALNRLTEDGLVECRDEVNPGKPSRKVYSITPNGRKAFLEALHQPIEPDVFKSQFLLVSMCAENVDPRTIAKRIDERIAYMDAMVDMLHRAIEECDNPGSRWTINYGLCIHQSCRDYLLEHRDELIAIAGTEHPAEAAE
jgi:DNA-binding PadR family transcriptional regulator